jgi:molybdopterin molybdotransferase
MSQPVAAPQRIARLMPLREIDALVDRLASPVRPETMEAHYSLFRVLAADVVAMGAHPSTAVAIRDGWAVPAGLVADAGAYSPVPLGSRPDWVNVGDPLPDGADAVLAPDAIGSDASSPQASASASAAPGEGVLPAGADAAPGQLLRRAGERVRETDIAVFRAVDVTQVNVRQPRVSLLVANPKFDETFDMMGSWLGQAVGRRGGVTHRHDRARRDLAQALRDDTVDLIITIGGTGAGRNDATVRALAAVGEVHVHGMGIRPGETAGLGTVGSRPVLLLPGRFDAALAAWLLVGRRLLDRLTGSVARELAGTGMLTRKVVSTVGVAEIVLLRRAGDGLEPIMGPYFPLWALAQADGWTLVPAESEGYQAGATVELRPLP